VILKEAFEPVDKEASESMSRIRTYVRDRNIGLLTAYRRDNSRDENLRRNADLEGYIRHGFGFIHVRGTYVLNKGNSNEKHFEEHSYLVMGKRGDDHGAMKGFLKKYGAKFDRESALYKPHDEKSVHLIGTSDQSDFLKMGEMKELGEFDPNLVAAYHSILMSRESAGVYEDGMTGVFEYFNFWESTTWFNRRERLWVPSDLDLGEDSQPLES
jgi:hypothetical protein